MSISAPGLAPNLPEKPTITRRGFLRSALASAAAVSASSAGLLRAADSNSAAAAVGARAAAGELSFRDEFLRLLLARVPDVLKSYDDKTGRFGQGIWICQDQNVMLALAVAYATPGEGSSNYKDARLLEIIMKAGDALIEDMDENGQWVFRKKDGSTWGKISMPWTYSRWIRAYGLIREDMPAGRRARWVQAFERGYAYIVKTQFGRLHNIPTHHAMSAYIAGKLLDHPEWCERAAKFLRDVAQAQFEGGYWSESQGPLVRYNFVYVEALGTYYKVSGDREVLPAIERAIRFHAHFTYPSGQLVETIDLRNPYSSSVLPGNPTFMLTPEGRAWLKGQWENRIRTFNEDTLALFLLHGEEGEIGGAARQPETDCFVLTEKKVDRAATQRQGPWFLCLSAYTAPLERDRWHQDRQNLVSIWHEKTGLILGGGNTKLQPAWSNFTAGKMDFLRHQPGDTNPDFLPKGELYHVPSAARLVLKPALGLDLSYGPETCRIRIQPRGDRSLEYTLEASAQSGLPVFAHLTLLPQLGTSALTGRGTKVGLKEAPVNISAADLGGALTIGNCRLSFPSRTTLHWPALPHDPYRKDGHATAAEGRIELRIPLDKQANSATVRIDITG